MTRELFLYTHKLRRLVRKKTFNPPYSVDSPQGCAFGSDYWMSHYYSIIPYNYTFDDYGLRVQDNTTSSIDYLDKEVIVCFGDSFTLNIGGPNEHSWPSHLQRYFNLPVLNIAVDYTGFKHFRVLWEKANELYDVKYAFVLYSLMPEEQHLFKRNTNYTDVFKDFEEYKIPDAVFDFTPPWSLSNEELAYIKQNYIRAFDYLPPFDPSKYQFDKMSFEKQYNLLRASDIVPLDKFLNWCNKVDDPMTMIKDAVDKDILDIFVKQAIFKDYRNRDGYHLSNMMNQRIAASMVKKFRKTFFDKAARNRLV